MQNKHRHKIGPKSIVKLQILYLLKKPRYGYEIIKKMDEIYHKKISAAHIYPFLKDLRENKYVKEKTSSIGKRKRKIYSLTPKGKKLLDSLEKEISGIIDTILKDKIKVCSHCGCKIYEGGVEKKIKGNLFFFCCESCADSWE